LRPAIGIPVALGTEALGFLGPGQRPPSGGEIRTARLSCGVDLLTIRSGVGTPNARSASARLVREGVGALLSVGVAGGLQAGSRVGDLIVADRIIGQGGDGAQGMWSSSARIVSFAVSALSADRIRARSGPILSVEEPVLRAGQKAALYKSTGAMAVDMESSAIAAVAADARLPFFALRAISDPPQRTIAPELAACLSPTGDVGPRVLLRHLLRRPTLTLELVRTGRDYALALSALKRAWGSLLRHGFPALIAGALSPDCRATLQG
jgi:adenosylhomocysteine nucleosidase